MKKLYLLILAVIGIASILPPIEGSTSRSIDITSLTIKFDRTDAEFTVNYDLGMMPKMYILLMGGKSIEPRIREVFPNFNYTIVRMDQKKAVLHIKNISRFEKNLNYYLHDSVKLGITINTMTVYVPGDDRPVEYFGVNATKNTFYRQ